MRIAIIDADLLDKGTRFPNLALMKISGYFKDKGSDVELITSYDDLTLTDYDEVYISKVFDYTRIDPVLLKAPNVYHGGTGFDDDKPLPKEIEHHSPDYTLYDTFIEKDKKHKAGYYKNYKNFSIGFTTRGCFRKCGFCVNRHYDRVEKHSDLSEWLDTSKKYIALCDDNILAFKDWKQIFKALDKTNKPFQFKQGLDIRLLTDEKADVLCKSKYHGEYTFAFDNYRDKDLIIEKLKLWRRHTNKATRFFVLAGFERQDEKEIENIFKRIQILSQFKCYPYLMRHKNYLNSKYKDLFIQLARWCNMPQFFKKMSFREFCNANQRYMKTKKLCASMRALNRFEEDFPEIADRYFNQIYFKG